MISRLKLIGFGLLTFLTAGLFGYAKYQEHKRVVAEEKAEKKERQRVIAEQHAEAVEEAMESHIASEKKTNKFITKREKDAKAKLKKGKRGYLSDNVNDY